MLDPFHPDVHTLLARERTELLRESMRQALPLDPEPLEQRPPAQLIVFPVPADPCLERRLRSVGS